MDSGFKVRSLCAPDWVALIILVFALAFPVAQSTAQITEEERDAERYRALDRLANELTSNGARGRIVERTPGILDFVFEGGPLILRISNPDQIAPVAVGPLLEIYGNLDTGSSIQVSDYKIAFAPVAIPPTGDIAKALTGPTDPLMEELYTVLSGFEEKVNEALKPGPTSPEDLDPEGGGPIPVEARRTRAAVADLYTRSVEAGDAQASDVIVANYTRYERQLKAIYGTYDNYPPWSYAQIYRNTNAVVAIAAREDSRVICSGVLVGRDLVLTAGHCFESDLPEELEVWFDFVEDQAGLRDPQTRRISELVAPSRDKRDAFYDQAFGRDLYDYAIVRFEQEGHEHLIPRVSLPSCQVEPHESPPNDAAPAVRAQWQDMRAEWQERCVRRPQCLHDARARRGRPLYVVGYPEGTREKVHDNGRVYLPDSITQAEFKRLKLSIAADYAAHDNREQILREFTKSYVPRDGRYFLESVLIRDQPTIGIVADTYRGNSGSPVYGRDGGHCIMGILIEGAEDIGLRTPAGWLHHESVLPVSAILKDLNAHDDTRVLLDQGLLQIE